MKNVLILHDLGGIKKTKWEKWLHDELLKRGYIVTMPNFTNADFPDRKAWMYELEQIMLMINSDQLIIIGHSIGVALALDYIEQSVMPVKALISVAGFTVDNGNQRYTYFLRQKDIDFKKVIANTQHVLVVYGENDPYVSSDSLQDLAQDLQVNPIIIRGGGHLDTDKGYATFPLILEAVEKIAALP